MPVFQIGQAVTTTDDYSVIVDGVERTLPRFSEGVVKTIDESGYFIGIDLDPSSSHVLNTLLDGYRGRVTLPASVLLDAGVVRAAKAARA